MLVALCVGKENEKKSVFVFVFVFGLLLLAPFFRALFVFFFFFLLATNLLDGEEALRSEGVGLLSEGVLVDNNAELLGQDLPDRGNVDGMSVDATFFFDGEFLFFVFHVDNSLANLHCWAYPW